MKGQTLFTNYLGGVAHVHTQLSNHIGHHESNLTLGYIVKHMRRAKLLRKNGPARFIIITEHTSDAIRPRRLTLYGLRHWRLMSQAGEYRRSILYGLEASLLPDGSIDVPDTMARERPFVIASKHQMPQTFSNDAAAITDLYIAACHNPLIAVLGHPQRHIEGTSVDWEAVFREAAATNTAIEVNVNSFPHHEENERLAIADDWLLQLSLSKAMISIGSDIHNEDQLQLLIKNLASPEAEDNHWRHVISAIQRAGIPPQRVLTNDLPKLKQWLATEKHQRS